jgi:Cft2 family RNA processing exonuclease
VRHLSFSAHADAKGILQLIRHCEPRAVMLVHGEKNKMLATFFIFESLRTRLLILDHSLRV